MASNNFGWLVGNGLPSINQNPLIYSLLSLSTYRNQPGPPPLPSNFLLLSGEDFELLNNNYLLLLDN